MADSHATVDAQTAPAREQNARRATPPAAEGRFTRTASGVAEGPDGETRVFVLRDIVCYQPGGGKEIQLPMQSYRLKSEGRQIDVHLPPAHPQVETMERHMRAVLAAMVEAGDYDAFTVDRETI